MRYRYGTRFIVKEEMENWGKVGDILEIVGYNEDNKWYLLGVNGDPSSGWNPIYCNHVGTLRECDICGTADKYNKFLFLDNDDLKKYCELLVCDEMEV